MTLSTVPPAARWLGLAGLLPFYLQALAIWILVSGEGPDGAGPGPVALQWAGFLVFSQLLYAAVVVSFIGAVQWGLAMANLGWEVQRQPVSTRINDGGDGQPRLEGATRQFLWSVVPALFGWADVLVFQFLRIGWVELAIMMILYVAAFAADRNAVRYGLGPEWYLELRKVLTIGVLVALGLTVFAWF